MLAPLTNIWITNADGSADGEGTNMILLNPISIRLDKAQDRWLLQRAKAQGVNVSKGLIIRMLIDRAMRETVKGGRA